LYAYEGLAQGSLRTPNTMGLNTQSGGTNPTSWKITYLYDEQGRPYGGVYRSPTESTTPLYFGILTSDRGDIVSLLDAAGAPFAAYRYDAWGKPTGTGNVGTGVWSKSTGLISLQVATDLAKRQPLRYASYCYDAESSLYYLSSRSYDPTTRQFLSKDLSRNDGEESAYQYCGGNPVAGVDPTGYRMDEFATSQERQAAEISRGRIKKAQRASKARAMYRRLNPGESAAKEGTAFSASLSVPGGMRGLLNRLSFDPTPYRYRDKGSNVGVPGVPIGVSNGTAVNYGPTGRAVSSVPYDGMYLGGLPAYYDQTGYGSVEPNTRYVQGGLGFIVGANFSMNLSRIGDAYSAAYEPGDSILGAAWNGAKASGAAAGAFFADPAEYLTVEGGWLISSGPSLQMINTGELQGM